MMSFAILYVLIFLLPYFLLALGQAIDYGDYKKNVQKSCESGYYMRLLNHFTHPEAFSSSNYIDGECVIKRWSGVGSVNMNYNLYKGIK